MSDPNPRKDWLSVLAKADPAALARHWEAVGLAPAHTVLRPAEIGGVMVQGRMGGAGDAFNLGEMTVTRCSVQLESGAVGHGYVQGRDKTLALQAALWDALMQTDAAGQVREGILDPLEREAAARTAALAARAAQTKVDFFTLVRGDS